MVFASYLFVVLLAAACAILPMYGLYYAASLNIRLVFQLFVLALGGIFIAGVLLWSMVPRRDVFEAPGPKLDRTSHPRFFAELDRVAESLQEKVPHEVYLIGAANAFVADRGGIMGFGSRRVMGVGLPFLDTMSIAEMRAVLAHEFGHYYGGDTKLGPWVYKTQTAMVRALQNVGSAHDGWDVGILRALFGVVFALLQGTLGLFLRVVNFVSRKQEFRADELACIVAGVPPQLHSLKKVHLTGAAWPSYWKTEVMPILNEGWIPEIGQGFSRFLSVPEIEAQVGRILAEEIAAGKTAPYDSHPPLRERLSAVEALRAQSPLDQSPLDSAMASSLFDDVRALELSFLEFIVPEFPKRGFRPVAWDEVARKVTIPSWKASLQQYSAVVKDATPESLPDLIPKLGQLSVKIPDPVGRILTGQERMGRVAQLWGVAVQLALLEKGWELVNLPGVFYLQRGEERIVPQAEIYKMAEGKITREDWAARCTELGIAQVALSSLGEQSAA
jgi:Zn-dependent protease with chaperone function